MANLYKLKTRIMSGRNTIGYEVLTPDGKLLKYRINDINTLAKRGQIYGIKYTESKDGLLSDKVNIRDIPTEQYEKPDEKPVKPVVNKPVESKPTVTIQHKQEVQEKVTKDIRIADDTDLATSEYINVILDKFNGISIESGISLIDSIENYKTYGYTKVLDKKNIFTYTNNDLEIKTVVKISITNSKLDIKNLDTKVEIYFNIEVTQGNRNYSHSYSIIKDSTELDYELSIYKNVINAVKVESSLVVGNMLNINNKVYRVHNKQIQILFGAKEALITLCDKHNNIIKIKYYDGSNLKVREHSVSLIGENTVVTYANKDIKSDIFTPTFKDSENISIKTFISAMTFINNALVYIGRL